MKAVILCGGLGTRLRSEVSDVPKSMAPIGGRPFLMYQINWLKKFEITNLVLCVGYMSEHIKNYFGDGSRFGVNITYSEEKELLGTAGAIKNAENLLNETFIVLNGDTYAKIDFKQLINFHFNNKNKYTIGLAKVNNKGRYGSVLLDKQKNITFFIEKSDHLDNSEGYINGGVYVFEPEIFNQIPGDCVVSLENEIFPKLINNNLKGFIWEGSFIDMGVPDSYKQLQNEVLKSLFVKPSDTVRDVLVMLDNSSMGIALVVNDDRELLGLVTDGDIRRFIIREDDLNKEIENIMIMEPVTARVGCSKEEIRSLANPRIKHIPLLDDKGIVKDIVLNADLIDYGEKITIRAKAPLRISFAGGGTDIYNYFKDHGGCVLNSSIDKYCRGTLIKRIDSKIKIHSYDFDISETIDDISLINYDGKLGLVKSVIKLMNPHYGFDLYLHSDVPPGTGLGSSASVAAVIANLMNHLKGEKLDPYQLSEIIYKAERNELNIAGGWQDQYATVFGGFNFMEFQEEEIIVHPLRISESTINELNNNLFLCYTGIIRSSNEIQSSLVKKQDKNSLDKDEDVLKALFKLKEITVKMRSALLKCKMEEFGKLLHEGWENKKRLDDRISNGYIDKLYNIGIKNGALGGKILGAGGGGYLLFFCSPLKKKKVVSKLQEVGGEIINFNFEMKGLTSWSVRS